MSNNIWLHYSSSIIQITEQNESFDSCIIRICYTGKNRNRSSISKQAIEDAIPSLYNCPIVCNYDVSSDTIGGHDVDIVHTNNGMRLINLTDAVGVIPSNCNYFWEIVEDDGIAHEYLCVEAILWKRSAAYSKIKRDGITSQSMEITVKDGKTVDGIYEIDKFIFTAFCLLGDDVEPCFESASLEMFALQRYKQTFEAMMDDFKIHFSTVITSNEDDINKQNLSKGGNITLDKTELLSEYGLTVNMLDFNIEDFTIDELREKFEAMKKAKSDDDDDNGNTPDTKPDEPDNPDTPEEPEPTEPSPEQPDESGDDQNSENGSEQSDDNNSDPDTNDTYSLTGQQFLNQLCEALSAIKYTDPYWGDMSRYMYVDHDYDAREVYCYDCEDWKLYGFAYSMNGDNVVIDFESKKRKKFSIIDFDEGDPDLNYKYAFEMYGKSISASKDAKFAEKQAQSTKAFNDLQAEVNALKQYKNSKLDEERKFAEDELFERFAELNGIEAFELLRSNCSDMTLEAIENKCFEIKGRNTTANFSVNKPKPTRIVIEKTNTDEPYGGLFLQYAPRNI